MHPSWFSKLRTWEFWQLPKPLMAVIASVVGGAFCFGLTSLPLPSAQSQDGRQMAVLLTLCIVFEEFSRRLERMRIRLTDGAFIDLTSVWTFAGAVLLAPGYATLLVVAVRAHLWFRKLRSSGVRLYREVFSASVIVLSCAAASAAHELVQPGDEIRSALRGAVAVTVALATYMTVNFALVFIVMYVAIRPSRLKALIASPGDYGLEFATLSLGALAAICLSVQPWLTPLLLAPMFLLQRSALVKQLEELASTDAKTGLLNAVAWQQIARRELSRADREGSSTSVLLVDLDYFKSVNDSHGHLLGDAALVAVGKAITQELRDYDTVGRFGGEEFVAVLPETSLEDAVAAAERVRARIESMRTADLGAKAAEGSTEHLSASIGVACYPGHGTALEQVLHEADAALYVAKRAGRNRVEVASPPASDDVVVMS